MHEGSRRLISTFAFVCLALMAGVCLADINLIEPDFTVKEGDRVVEIIWHDPDPQALVGAPEARLGSTQYPWRGKAGFAFGGFYQGACDWTYDVSVIFNVDSTTISWSEVTDWKTLARRTRLLRLEDTDHFYDFSDSIKIMVPSAGLFVPGFAEWQGTHPVFNGIYRGGTPSDTAVAFSFTCVTGGSLGGQPGGEVRLAWTNALGQSGSVAATQAGTVVGVVGGLKIGFASGDYPEGQGFSVLVMVPFAQADPLRGLPADAFKVRASTFEGYLVLRRSVEDRVSDGDTLYKVVADIARCKDPEFFADANGKQDPFGTRHYTDKGIPGGEIGVSRDSTASVVLNGFPYRYSVITYDWSSDYRMLTSDTLWVEVFPSVSPIGKTVRDVYVVPNPYTFRAGWEQGGEAKLQFVNVPIGAVIKIFDASGGQVATVVPRRNLDGSQAGTADWHLVDNAGEQVVSGIYMFRVEAGGDAKMGRFIVIR